MVQYEGHVTKDGELIVNMSGSFVSLHEFLQESRVAGRKDARRENRERRRVRTDTVAVAK